jgi:hypothetical protein
VRHLFCLPRVWCRVVGPRTVVELCTNRSADAFSGNHPNNYSEYTGRRESSSSVQKIDPEHSNVVCWMSCMVVSHSILSTPCVRVNKGEKVVVVRLSACHTSYPSKNYLFACSCSDPLSSYKQMQTHMNESCLPYWVPYTTHWVRMCTVLLVRWRKSTTGSSTYGIQYSWSIH